MKNPFKWIASSIRNKLALVFVMFIIPFSISHALFIEQSALVIEAQLVETAGEGHNAKKMLLDEILISIISAASFYQSDTLFLYGLKYNYPYPIDSIDLYEQIWGRSRNITAVYPAIRRIRIYTDNPSLVETSPFVHHIGGYFDQTTAYRALSGGAFGYWAPVRSMAPGMEYWDPGGGAKDGTGDRLFAYSVMLTRKGFESGFASFLTVEYNAYQMDVILGDDDSQVLSALVDESNAPVDPCSSIGRFSPVLPVGFETVTARQITFGGSEYLLWVTPLKNGWKLVSVATMERILEEADNMRRLGMVFVLLFGIAFITIVLIVTNRFMQRSKLLAERMSGFRAETWEPYELMKGSDEISVIDKAFLSMGQKLRDSIRQNYLQEIEKKQAELSRLHIQIRPHFLYNMLSSIAWVIDDKPRPVARQAIENLASFYRYSLANGREIITLGEELRIVNTYMELQRLRIKEQICFISQVEPLFYEVKIPRMTLQPLVENSILYGPGEERRMVSIVLSAAVCGDKILLSLEDDGVGMSPETLRKLREGNLESMSGSGLGYKTVNERIQLYFGPGYGVEINSEPGRGTLVCIYLPVTEA